MDEGKPPKELTSKIFYGVIVAIIMTILFILEINSGIYIVLGLLLFMIIFSNMNKSLLKKEIQNSKKYNDNWYVSRYNLSKEIP